MADCSCLLGEVALSQADNEPNHRRFNEQQWGAFLKPEGNGKERRQTAATFFDRAFGIDLPPGEKEGLIRA